MLTTGQNQSHEDDSGDAKTSDITNEGQSTSDLVVAQTVNQNVNCSNSVEHMSNKDSTCERTCNLDAMKKRTVDNTDNDEEQSKVLPKKTRLFGSINLDSQYSGGGNYFSKAINKLASQNISIKPLSSQKSDVFDDTTSCNEDSRMSWKSEPSSKQLFSNVSKISVKDVTVETGEENEYTVTEVNGRLYMFSSESGAWKERGRGILKLNDKIDNTDVVCSGASSRLVMRSTGTLRLLLNSNVFSKMDVNRTSSTSVRFSAQHSGGIRIFSIRASPSDCDQLMCELQWRIDQASYASDEIGNKSAQPLISTNSKPKWLQQVFKKSCHLIDSDIHQDDEKYSLLLCCDKYLRQTRSEHDYIFKEISLSNEGDKKDMIFQVCLDDVLAVKKLEKFSIEIILEDEKVYKLKFRDSCDMSIVFQELRNFDNHNSRNSSSSSSATETLSSSSSYASVKEEADDECSSNQSSRKSNVPLYL